MIKPLNKKTSVSILFTSITLLLTEISRLISVIGISEPSGSSWHCYWWTDYLYFFNKVTYYCMYLFPTLIDALTTILDVKRVSKTRIALTIFIPICVLYAYGPLSIPWWGPSAVGAVCDCSSCCMSYSLDFTTDHVPRYFELFQDFHSLFSGTSWRSDIHLRVCPIFTRHIIHRESWTNSLDSKLVS